MARGPLPGEPQREEVRELARPILERHLRPEQSARAWERYQEMRRQYRLAPWEEVS